MNRSSFIRNLVGAFGVAVLPVTLITSYQKIYLLQCFIRGFRFYNGESMLHQMAEGDMLELVREPTNTYDDCAVALHFNKEKIGFVPAESNEVLSRLMDAKVVDLQAQITHIEKKAQAWENVHIAIYVLKENGQQIVVNKPYLTELETPNYHTLNYNDDTFGRVYYTYGNDEPDDEYVVEDFYQDLVDNHATENIYLNIHQNLDADSLADAVKNNRFVTKISEVPPSVKMDNVIQTLDDAVINLDNYFNESGLVNVNVQNLAQLPQHIKTLVHTLDKQGNKFVEVVFNGN